MAIPRPSRTKYSTQLLYPCTPVPTPRFKIGTDCTSPHINHAPPPPLKVDRFAPRTTLVPASHRATERLPALAAQSSPQPPSQGSLDTRVPRYSTAHSCVMHNCTPPLPLQSHTRQTPPAPFTQEHRKTARHTFPFSPLGILPSPFFPSIKTATWRYRCVP